MSGYIEIVLIYIFFLNLIFSIREACKEKLVLAKLRAVLACAESISRSVRQLWISARNLEKSTWFLIDIFFLKFDSVRVSLHGVTYFVNISAKTNF